MRQGVNEIMMENYHFFSSQKITGDLDKGAFGGGVKLGGEGVEIAGVDNPLR